MSRIALWLSVHKILSTSPLPHTDHKIIYALDASEDEGQRNDAVVQRHHSTIREDDAEAEERPRAASLVQNHLDIKVRTSGFFLSCELEEKITIKIIMP